MAPGRHPTEGVGFWRPPEDYWFPSLLDGEAPTGMIRNEPQLAFHSTALDHPDLWSGRCSLHMDSPSATDPIHLLAPIRILAGFCGTYDMITPHGTPTTS